MSALITLASISSVTPGSVAILRARLGRGLAGRGVGERLNGRSQDDVGAAHRRGDGARRLGGVGGALRHQRKHGVRAGAAGLAAQPLAQAERRGVGDDQHLLALADAEALRDHRADRAIQIVGFLVRASLGHGSRP